MKLNVTRFHQKPLIEIQIIPEDNEEAHFLDRAKIGLQKRGRIYVVTLEG